MTFFKAGFYFIILILPTHAFANTLSLTDIGDDTWNVNYFSDGTIGGFQFDVDGATINSASGGAAGDAGFMVSSSATTALGFSLSGATIPLGEGILVVLDLDGTPEGLSGIVVSDPDAIDMGFTYDNSDDGCTDMAACNYNADAAADNGSCDYGTMCWDGSYECDAADCPDIPVGTVEVLYNSDTPIAGFQFNVYGVTVTAASGGAAAAAGFMVSSSATTVLGFSLSGSTIPSGEGVLVLLEVEGDVAAACLSDVIISNSAGAALDNMVEDCLTITYMAGCMDMDACNYNVDATGDDGSCTYAEENYDCDGNCIAETDCLGECGGIATVDECGVCNGDGYPDGACDCDGNVSDCSGECGGSAMEDECGVCNGDGASCAIYMVDVLFNSDTDIAGFQFNIENVVLIGASGGEAEANGLMVSTGNNTVLGFSLTGSVIPAGSGVLITLEVEGQGTCISDLILSDSNADALDATIDDCLNIYYTTPIPGCTDELACNYNADAETDDGSCDYPEDNYDCDGNCIAELDCTGECGGSTIFDECGVCGGSGIPLGECDCNGNVDDCAGDCGGIAVEDDCGVCDGDGTSCLFVTLSFGVVTESSVEIWLDNPLDVAGFQFNISGLNITGASGGSAEDNGFMVSSSATTVIGFSLTGAVIPVGNALLMNLSFDGITGDDICLSDAVISDSWGNGIDCEVGSCLNPADDFNGGCSDVSACNYIENTDFDDGSCTYAEENFDCDGNCLLELDCAGVCGGSSTIDECDICGGSGPEANYDCEGNCLLEYDCANVCGGSSELDECAVCGGDGSGCDNPQATLSFGDLGGDVMLQVAYEDPFGDICIVSPIISDAVGVAVSTIIGECILLESSGSLDIYLNSSIDIAGFQFNLSGLTITGASGGNAEANGFVISTSASTVIGFSLTGSTIDANGSVGCMDESACNFDPYATIPGGCQYEVDCLGICGGMAEEDECGLCNGTGAEIECWDGELVCNAENCSDEPVFTDVDYLTEIQPILNANCTFYCHSGGGVYEGGLDLTSYENLMAGDSNHGPVVMPGDSENSILIQKLGDEPPFGDQMPQNGPPYLDAYTIALIAAWIDEGALPSDDDNNEVVEGCTDPNANNYDSDATDDDGSCTYDPLGELTFGNIDYDNGTLEINLDCEYEVSSFVFDLTGINLTGYYGGTTETAGFDISIGGAIVSGNSIENNIPANSGLLMVVTFDAVTAEEICFGSSTITTFVGIEYEAILDDCIIIDNDLSIDLISGWNWISFNVNPEDASLSSMLGSVGDDATFISSQSSGTAQNYGTYGWYGALTELDPTQMYKLQMTAAVELVITGVPVDVVSTPISLIAGWNWIGYLPQNAGALGEALGSVGDDATFISSQSSGTAQNYGDYGWYGALTTLEPGNGYLLDMSGPGELVYPEFNGLARLDENKIEVVLSETISDWEFNYADYRYIGTITASIDSRKDFDGDVVAVFVDDQCRGIAERMYFPFDDRYMYIIQAYSNIAEGEEMTFRHFDSARDEVIEYGETISFNSNMVVGDGFNTFGLSREGSFSQPKTYGISDAYPNPFNPVTSFEYTLEKDGMVQVAVYDINGRMVSELLNGYQSAGSYPVVWDANELSSGVYLVNMTAGEFTTVQKIMLIK